jgi:hypothetical protein
LLAGPDQLGTASRLARRSLANQFGDLQVVHDELRAASALKAGDLPPKMEYSLVLRRIDTRRREQ